MSIISRLNILRNIEVNTDGLWACVICLLALLSNAVVVGMDASFGLIIHSVIEKLESSASTISWIPSIRSTCMYLFAWISTSLTQRYGFRIVFMAGAILSCLASVGAVFSENFVFLLLSYGVIGGAGAGLLFAPGNIVASYYFDKYRKIATGFAICGGGIGIAIIDPLINLITIKFGYRGVFVSFSLLSLLPLLLSIALFPTKGNDNNHTHGNKEFQEPQKSIGWVINVIFWLFSGA